MPADAVGAVAGLAASRLGVTTRAQAASLGLTPRLVRRAIDRGWLTEPLPGVLAFPGHADSWQRRLAIVTASNGDRAVVSHRAAARLHGLDGFRQAPPEITMLQPTSLHLPRAYDDVVRHQAASVPEDDVVHVHGLRVTGLARTLADVGSVVSADLVRKALIDARRRDVSPIWLRRTAVRLHRPGQAGTGRLLAALRRWEQEGTLPESWFEELVHRMLRHPELADLVRQHEIRDASGRIVARCDLAIPSARLGIEAHSKAFHFGPTAEARDADRDLRVAAEGWELIYLGWFSQRSPATVLDVVLRVARHRRALLGNAA